MNNEINETKLQEAYDIIGDAMSMMKHALSLIEEINRDYHPQSELRVLSSLGDFNDEEWKKLYEELCLVWNMDNRDELYGFLWDNYPSYLEGIFTDVECFFDNCSSLELVKLFTEIDEFHATDTYFMGLASTSRLGEFVPVGEILNACRTDDIPIAELPSEIHETIESWIESNMPNCKLANEY